MHPESSSRWPNVNHQIRVTSPRRGSLMLIGSEASALVANEAFENELTVSCWPKDGSTFIVNADSSYVCLDIKRYVLFSKLARRHACSKCGSASWIMAVYALNTLEWILTATDMVVTTTISFVVLEIFGRSDEAHLLLMRT